MAERLLHEALQTRRGLLGREHPDVAATMSELAVVSMAKGEYGAAEQLSREALAMRLAKALLGERHERTRQTAARLVHLYEAWGKPDKAAEYEALEGKPAGT